MSWTRNGKQIILLRVLSLRRSKFLESQWKSLVELSGESERTTFEFQGWNLVPEPYSLFQKHSTEVLAWKQFLQNTIKLI